MKKTVILVEDDTACRNSSFRSSIAHRTLNISLQVSVSGRGTQEDTPEADPDVILLDINLPGLFRN